MKTSSVLLGVCAALSATVLPACGQHEVSYQHEVLPILKASCFECHTPGGVGYEKSKLDMSSYDTLMKGTQFGPVVKPGDTLTSVLVMLIENRADVSIHMPYQRNLLPQKSIDTIKTWVAQGAKNN
ncbi:MAG: hypothetical protein KGJ15_01775 [Betaproteobacteria bacterium]|nr:hypothetical protein [Betaproteobacteria bacterium]MDE2131468.1 hypothetical protein [Betaproteobacteria bacterium]MDE2211182.1 hypothetical protein [Betaproteobacteria bacterium]